MKKCAMYIIAFILLFQESLERIFKISVLGYTDELFILIWGIYAIIKCMKEKKVNKKSVAVFCGAIFYFFIGIYSGIRNSKFIVEQEVMSGITFIKFFLVIVLSLNYNWNKESKSAVIDVLKKYGLIVLVFAIINFILQDHYYSIFSFALHTKRFGINALTSLFYHPGYYGWFMLFISLIYYSELKQKKSKKIIIKVIIYYIFAILSLRTKVIAVGIFVILLDLILDKKISIKKVMVGIIIASTMFIAFNKFITYTYELYISTESEETARSALKKNGRKIAREYFPIGVGFGKYGSSYAKKYYSEYYYKYDMNGIYGLSPEFSAFSTDVFWPAVMGETGYVGVCIYGITLIYIAINLFKKRKDKMADLAIYAFLQTFCESFGGQSFVANPQAIVVAIIIGIGLKNIQGSKKNG